jgi:hypothetical protein
MKKSAKMQKSIAKLEKKFGKLVLTFGSNETPYNKEFYCFCRVRCEIIKSLSFTVLHDGSVHNM